MGSPGVTGIVLAGGRSSRFGGDKLAARFPDGPLLHRPVRALAAVCDEVIVVVRHDGIPPELPVDLPVRVRTVRDDEPFAGPLAGLMVGLERAAHPIAVVVGGDMPDPSPEVLRLLATDLADQGVESVCLEFEGQPQPLPFAVRGEAAASVRALVGSGERSLVAYLRGPHARSVPEARWRPLDPEGLSLRDVDRPAELEAAGGSVGSASGLEEEEQENTSGGGWRAEVPRELKRWNWGAFLIGPIWGIGNRIGPAAVLFVPAVLLAFGLIPPVLVALASLPAPFILGIKGNDWSWKFKRWTSVERFQTVQRRWAWAGLASIVLGSLVVIFVQRSGQEPGVYADHGIALRYPDAWRHGEADPELLTAGGDPDQPAPLWSEEFAPDHGGGAVLYALEVTLPEEGINELIADEEGLRSMLMTGGLTLRSPARRLAQTSLPGIRFTFDTPPGSEVDEGRMFVLFGPERSYWLACLWRFGSVIEIGDGCWQMVTTFRLTGSGDGELMPGG